MDTTQTQMQPVPKAQKERKLPRIARRHVVIACTVLLIAAAVVLNLVLFNKAPTLNDPTTDADSDASGEDQPPALETDGYFSATQVSRQRARDEALEVLQGVVDSEDADESTKTGALLEISELARAMEAEANIETLVLAKGFTQCVAVINGDTCSVVVNGEGELQSAQISQINEIVYEQTGILPTGIRIITK